MKTSLLHAARAEADRKASQLIPTTSAASVPLPVTLDLEAVCAAICETKSMRQIAEERGVPMSTLLDWIEADPERVARTREARRRTALLWEERAEAVLAQAGDNFELQKARELAHHYRWRAKVIAPREYGDKVTQEVTGAGGAPLAVATVNFKQLSDKELEAMQAMLAKAAAKSEAIDVETKTVNGNDET